MALPTYLSIVNDVMVRLREPTVSSVSENTLSALVGKFVNDTKRQVADSYDWDAFNTSITVSTTAGQYSGYQLVGSGVRFKTMDVINISRQYPLEPITHQQLDLYYYSTTNPQQSSPFNYTYGPIETIEIIENCGWAESYCYGNIIKYVTRAQHKGNELQDLRKARWYIDRLIEQLTKEQSCPKDSTKQP